MGSPRQAAGEKPWKAGTENKQKPFSDKLCFDRPGKGGSSSQGAGKKQPRAKGGSVTAESAEVPRCVPPPNGHPQLSKKLLLPPSCRWDKSTVPFRLSRVLSRRWDVPQRPNAPCCDLRISAENKCAQHEQSPQRSRARPHAAVFVCGGTGCSGQRQHLPGKFPFRAIEQRGKLKIDCSAEAHICFARRYRLSLASGRLSARGAPGQVGALGRAPAHEASASPGQGKATPSPACPPAPPRHRGSRRGPAAALLGSDRRRADFLLARENSSRNDARPVPDPTGLGAVAQHTAGAPRARGTPPPREDTGMESRGGSALSPGRRTRPASPGQGGAQAPRRPRRQTRLSARGLSAGQDHGHR